MCLLKVFLPFLRSTPHLFRHPFTLACQIRFERFWQSSSLFFASNKLFPLLERLFLLVRCVLESGCCIFVSLSEMSLLITLYNSIINNIKTSYQIWLDFLYSDSNLYQNVIFFLLNTVSTWDIIFIFILCAYTFMLTRGRLEKMKHLNCSRVPILYVVDWLSTSLCCYLTLRSREKGSIHSFPKELVRKWM